MSVTSGFFNSTNRDRLYNATDFGRFFEGIVTDGVIKDFRDGLEVTNLQTLGFQVKPGKAMFNGVWISSDGLVVLSPAAVVTPDSYRIFAVVVEVNYATREGSIKLVSTSDISLNTTLADGVQNVLKPLLRNDATRYSGIHQYVMAIGTRNTASVLFSNFAFLTGQTLASSSPYYSIQEFIAPYAIGLSYEGTIPDPFNYENATNKPQINGVTLSGNKTATDLGLVPQQSVKFIGAATKATASNTVYLSYSGLSGMPSSLPKKITLYGALPSSYPYKMEFIRPVSANTYGNVFSGSNYGNNEIPYLGTGAYATYELTNDGTGLTLTLPSVQNASSMYNVYETELAW